MHRRSRIALAFTLLFICVDWMSYVHPLGDLNITPWNPPAALEVLFLAWGGLSWMAWVYLTLALSDWLVRDSYVLSASVLVGNAVLVACYASVSRVLLALMQGKPRLQSRSDVAKLGLISTAGAAITACLYVGTQTLLGNLDRQDFWEASHRFFVGDLLGLMVVLPLSFLLIDGDRRKQFVAMFQRRSYWLLMLGLTACIVYVFSLPAEMQMKYFFPFFFAVGLIGAAHSLPGSTLAAAIVQAPLIWSSTHAGVEPSALIDMQIVMLTLSLTGLIIGVVVDERLRIQEKLKESLQLVAAGELAGSLAHELHQPMNALNAYAESALILSESALKADTASQVSQLQSTLRQITQETARASEIVKGLRSFFISGTSHLVPTDLSALVTDCAFRLQAEADKFKVRVDVQAKASDLVAWVDPTQIQTAVGNLLKNALESAGPGGWVTLEVNSAGPQKIAIDLLDSGRTLSIEEAERIFKPFVSTKKEGLGLGLSISKSLIENNDGVLQYHATPRKHFRILLPRGK